MLKDWETTTFDDVGVGNIVEHGPKLGEVRAIRVVSEQGATLGQIELYVQGIGLVTGPHGKEIGVFR